MLYVFYGSDRESARAKASALIAGLQKKKPDAELFRLDADTFRETQLDELIGGQGLFNKTYLVVLSYLFENEEVQGVVLKKLSEVADSPNIFVMLEGELPKAILIEITEAAEKALVFEKKGEKKEAFNIFSLTDALGRRDKKNLWMLFQKALREDFAPEHINGVLFWKVKSLLTAPYSNRSWRREELKDLSRRLVSLYHDSHRGIHDFAIGLERFVLTL